MSSYEERSQRTQWFRDARFGLFIHWGLYAIPARGEWVRSPEKLTVEDYEQYFREFNPKRYQPKEWARMAKEAGMKYAVLTAKHHDGFCLFDSKLTDYKAPNTQAGRDLVREYVDAFREEGLKVGLYYSLLDWHHPDYPHYGHMHHPMRDNEAFKDKPHQFERYVEYFHGQVRELLSNYGKIDILWFDFSYEDMSGEKWQATKLMKMVRELQPGVLIDSRLGGDMTEAEPAIYAGDFGTPEQMIPTTGMTDKLGRPIPWEACVTQNGAWGFHRNDSNFMSARQVVRTLVNCVSKGGNLLINAGPTAMGEVPPKQAQILDEVGEWMLRNDESVYDCGPSEFPKPEWGRLTQNGKRLFAHVQEPGIGVVILPGLKGKLRNARLLATGHEVNTRSWFSDRHADDLFLFIGHQDTGFDPVIELEIV